MMNDEAKQYLGILVDRIHTVVLSTNGEDGYPHTCAVDMMHLDDDGVYFLTARGKSLHSRLSHDGRLSLTGLKGEDTMSSVALSVVGEAGEVGPSYLPALLERNPYMLEIYPTERSREALTVFRISRGRGEWFDLSKRPIERAEFSFGGMDGEEAGYEITASCDGCGACLEACPQSCIDSSAVPFRIVRANCLRCGNCMEACPSGAVLRRGHDQRCHFRREAAHRGVLQGRGCPHGSPGA